MSKQTSSQIDLDKFYCQHKCLLYKVENENCVIIYLPRYSSVNAMKFIDDVVVGFMFIICVLYWLSYDIICAYAICSSISSLLFQILSCTEKKRMLGWRGRRETDDEPDYKLFCWAPVMISVAGAISYMSVVATANGDLKFRFRPTHDLNLFNHLNPRKLTKKVPRGAIDAYVISVDKCTDRGTAKVISRARPRLNRHFVKVLWAFFKMIWHGLSINYWTVCWLV